jgi:hypothetical protein
LAVFLDPAGVAVEGNAGSILLPVALDRDSDLDVIAQVESRLIVVETRCELLV